MRQTYSLYKDERGANTSLERFWILFELRYLKKGEKYITIYVVFLVSCHSKMNGMLKRFILKWTYHALEVNWRWGLSRAIVSVTDFNLVYDAV